jgi:hypothetical protein
MGQQQGKTYTSGFHVLHVTPNSPGEQAGIVSFFDFIVAANGVLLVCILLCQRGTIGDHQPCIDVGLFSY